MTVTVVFVCHSAPWRLDSGALSLTLSYIQVVGLSSARAKALCTSLSELSPEEFTEDSRQLLPTVSIVRYPPEKTTQTRGLN